MSGGKKSRGARRYPCGGCGRPVAKCDRRRVLPAERYAPLGGATLTFDPARAPVARCPACGHANVLVEGSR